MTEFVELVGNNYSVEFLDFPGAATESRVTFFSSEPSPPSGALRWFRAINSGGHVHHGGFKFIKVGRLDMESP